MNDSLEYGDGECYEEYLAAFHKPRTDHPQCSECGKHSLQFGICTSCGATIDKGIQAVFVPLILVHGLECPVCHNDTLRSPSFNCSYCDWFPQDQLDFEELSALAHSLGYT